MNRSVAIPLDARIARAVLLLLPENPAMFLSCQSVPRSPSISMSQASPCFYSYAEHLQAHRVSVARAAAFLWVRFHGSRSARDLLFRVLPGSQPEPSDLTREIPNAFQVSADR